ncbi:hypothetical protein T4E_6816 [Trichinella pseudospiralis]|uniref:Uncharacterized protein n=1 Tax=Trichinella pseudospiralis TaxID=6337 RepID=A0A0V0XGR0_TRIPS|nr:hypothetical protein T4E_6816 [Trichinella pseudospiralis]
MLNKLNSGINFVAVGGMFRINKRNAYCIHKNKEAIHATLTICTSLPIKPLRKISIKGVHCSPPVPFEKREDFCMDVSNKQKQVKAVVPHSQPAKAG